MSTVAERPAQQREFAYEPTDFEKVRRCLMRKAGIKLSDSKDAMVYSRLVRRIRVLGMSSFSDYLKRVERDESEVEHFINALTTNLTSFFREPHHFEALAGFIERQSDSIDTIWCAASSTGEEPYSIAMVVAEMYGSFRPPVKIIASDIDSRVLDKAKAGIYPAACMSKLSPARQKQFFYRGKGANAGKVRVADELRKMVSFRRVNLTDASWEVPDKLDVIFCRNVMIYFDKPTQLRILSQMVSKMKPQGLYIAGHSENFNAQSNLVVPVGKTIYQPARGCTR